MPITLEAAKAAAEQGRWHSVLGLQPGASADDIRKARRLEQRTAHTDKGGCTELSQLINQAADELLKCYSDALAPPTGEWWEEFVRQSDEEIEKRRRNMEEEVRKRMEQQRREQEERWNRIQELRRDQRALAHKNTVRRVGHRRTRCKGLAYLGELAGKAFPAIKYRIRKLQDAGKHHRAQALAYAVEAEIASRRLARETSFPKTERLAERDAQKAACLDKLRPLYQKAYDRLRYVRRAGKPEDFARLCVQRLLAQAWNILLDMPSPLVGDEAIVMADFSP
jgi:hypothetical protein